MSRQSHTISADVCEERIWRRIGELAQFGATTNGGVNRLAFTDAEIGARRLLCGWAAEFGASVSIDGVGNMFARTDADSSGMSAVLTGSHIDTVPTGGRFDGAYGVVAAFEVLQVLQEQGIKTAYPVEAVVWANEEGARFAPGQMGAGVFVGARNLEHVLEIRDAKGVTVAQALGSVFAALPNVPRRTAQQPPKAFIEAHIEQGPLLEASDVTIGAVTGIQGRRSFLVDVKGMEAHGGTAKPSDRKDALLAAVGMVHSLKCLCADTEDQLRFTVGVFNVFPGAPLVVPGHVHFTIDIRHPDNAVMQRVGDQIAETCRLHAAQCEVSVLENAYAESVHFPADVVALVEQQADRSGYRCERIYSLAGHDARELSKMCPTGMVFVPCRAGISHNETESATKADLAAGAQVLLKTVTEMAGVSAD